MEVRRVDLHIGVEKTGTSTIQRSLARARGELQRAGVCYPTSLGKVNHVGLAVVGRDDDVTDDIRQWRGLVTAADVRADRARMADALRDEVESSGADRVLLSNEHCSARLRSQEDVRRLVTWLAATIGGELHVHVYLRPQVAMLESRHSTAVRAGTGSELRLPNEEQLRFVFDFEALLDRWAAVVGEEHIHPRRFERARFSGGDVVTDFAASLELPPIQVASSGDANVALDAPTQRFLALMNGHVPRFLESGHNPVHGWIVAAVDQLEPQGPPERLRPEDAARMIGWLRESNDAVASRWFDGPPLFEPEGQRSRPGGDPDELDAERAVAIAAHVIKRVAAASATTAGTRVAADTAAEVLHGQGAAQRASNEQEVASEESRPSSARAEPTEGGVRRRLRWVARRIRGLW